jgi:hypothetical protein
MDDPVQHLIHAIPTLRRIRGKMVILCEGGRADIDHRGPRSPQMYAHLAQMPDANFYENCLPRSWIHNRPVFFNCGSRAEVFKVFGGLLAAHAEAPGDSYLTPGKLYALVDLDLQAETLPPSSGVANTEDLHIRLYQNGELRPDIPADQRIFVTSLIHKEAFFLLPTLTDAILERPHPPFFRDRPLTDLQALHQAIADRLPQDRNFAKNLPTALQRLSRFPAATALSCACGATLRDAWSRAQQDPQTSYDALVHTLLAVAGAKPIWSELGPSPPDSEAMHASDYRDQLALAIADAISRLTPEQHPLTALFRHLEAHLP